MAEPNAHSAPEEDGHPPAGSWQFTGDPAGFLDRAGPFLHAAPATHTLLLTVTEQLRARGLHLFGDADPAHGLWTDPAGEVAGAFVRTPPMPLLLSPLPSGAPGPETAADALAVALADRMPDLTGVSSESFTAAAFADAWRRHTGATTELRDRLRLYRLGTLTPPRTAPAGRARTAGPQDRDVLLRWYEGFHEDTGATGWPRAEEWVDARLAQDRAVTLWETPDGTPAAMAAVTPRVAGQVRIGAVYTPPGLRGRGYAGAATAVASAQARDAGADQVLLFTDLANPTSNGLYRRLGYRPVRDYAVHAFS